MHQLIKALRGRKSDEGFTLIELMVVVLIIAILMAIAIPTFLSARNTANARAAQENVRNAITAEATQYANNNAYSNSLSTLKAAEPALGWNGLTPAGTAMTTTGNNVYVGTDTAGQNVIIGAEGADKNCYFALDANGAVSYGYAAPSSGNCAVPSTFYASWSDAVAGKASTGTTTVTSVPTVTAAS